MTLAMMRTAPQTAVISKGGTLKELFRKRIAQDAHLVAAVSPTLALTFNLEVTGADPARPNEVKLIQGLRGDEVQALIALSQMK